MSLIRTIVDAVSLGAGLRAAWSPYVQMGQGIAGRSLRCHNWWSQHLFLSREFITNQVFPVRKVAVLGAGRLLDLDLEHLLSNCEELHLFDLDPSAVQIWRQRVGVANRDRVFFRCEDVTSCMRGWERQLRTASRKGRLQEGLYNLQAPTPHWVSESFDGVISLNILGQIPLYWRDRVITMHPANIQMCTEELQASMAKLQVEHLSAILSAGKCWSVVVSDAEYYYYRDGSQVWEWEDALFGAANEIWRAQSATAIARDAWWWHLAPQFIERADYGEIHKVEAAVWRRSMHT